MDEKTLARELVRARLDDLADMKKKLEKMAINLEKILRFQLGLLSVIEENEERSYALAAALDDGNTTQDGISFGVLFEMAINRLNVLPFLIPSKTVVCLGYYQDAATGTVWLLWEFNPLDGVNDKLAAGYRGSVPSLNKTTESLFSCTFLVVLILRYSAPHLLHVMMIFIVNKRLVHVNMHARHISRYLLTTQPNDNDAPVVRV
ncbi:hypothetical protein PHYPSEUDO_006568 [Phytophthora pseudosyringae]|uniref:Uncharacterized protein n=1 Tax=Phytophthora pseudosyringae TaxID=221518 RepID=A0A8T1VIQ5_9STRA|nr:hypothetical protein PHYPSEUDO_006568 [Phytophthora pseudosyringae]